MDNIKVGRTKKSDKAKQTYERNGGFSQKHIRIAELLAARRLTVTKPANGDKPKSK